jgi:hypothetical protein
LLASGCSAEPLPAMLLRNPEPRYRGRSHGLRENRRYGQGGDVAALTPASPADLPPLGALVADDPSWRYPAGGLAREGVAHLRVWLTAGPEPGHLAVVTETGLAASVTESAGHIWAALARRYGCRCRKLCHVCDLGVFVYQAAEPVPPPHPDTCVLPWYMRASGGRVLPHEADGYCNGRRTRSGPAAGAVFQ